MLAPVVMLVLCGRFAVFEFGTVLGIRLVFGAVLVTRLVFVMSVLMGGCRL
jgi:hypothetical protein